jgi:hypothetical protein
MQKLSQVWSHHRARLKEFHCLIDKRWITKGRRAWYGDLISSTADFQKAIKTRMKMIFPNAKRNVGFLCNSDMDIMKRSLKPLSYRKLRHVVWISLLLVSILVAFHSLNYCVSDSISSVLRKRWKSQVYLSRMAEHFDQHILWYEIRSRNVVLWFNGL